MVKAQELAKKEGDNLTVQVLCGSVLADAGWVEEALALLAKHQGSLDAYVYTPLPIVLSETWGSGMLTLRG